MEKVFDRSAFKAAKLSANKQSKALADAAKTISSAQSEFLKIEEGINVFRLLPPHNPENASWYAKVVSWLPVLVKDKETGKSERINKPIFDARSHGGLSRDIVSEYVSYVTKSVYEEIQDTKDAVKKLSPVNGFRSKDGKWQSGIKPSSSYMGYCVKGPLVPANIGRLEIYKSDLDKLDNLTVNSDTSDDAIDTDIFSDPTDGVQFIINRRRVVDKTGKESWERIFSKATFDPPKGLKGNQIAQAYEDWQKSQIVPDEVLKEWLKLTPLQELFVNSYRKEDFERALEALQYFDKYYHFNIFDDDDWLDIVESVQKEVFEYLESKEKERPANDDNDDEPEEDENEDLESLLDELLKADRKRLKAINMDYGLGITVTKNFSDNDLRELVREAINSKIDDATEPEESDDEPDGDDDKLPFDTNDDEPEEASPKTEESSTVLDLQARLQARRNKRN